LPAMINTLSFLRIFISKHLRSQGNYLHKILVPQFPRNRSKYAGTLGVALIVEYYCGIVIEAHIGTIRPMVVLGDSHDDRLDDVTFFNHPAGYGALDAAGDDISHRGIAPAGASRYPYAHHLARTRVIRNF
jgi:hypothetical protein